MPSMIRPNDKATKIAYKVLGVPESVKQEKKKKRNKKKELYEFGKIPSIR